MEDGWMEEVAEDDIGVDDPIEVAERRRLALGQQQGEQEIQHRQIESMDHWLASNSLQDTAYGMLSERNLSETAQRLQDESEYQESVLRSIFAAQDNESQEQHDRHRILESSQQESITIRTSTDELRDIPLKPLAAACDTLFSLVSFHQTHHRGEETRLTFALDTYQHQSVVEFVDIALGNKKPDDVSADCVVECCQIASYMQCPTVLDDMVNILERSIDNGNCLSLCALADQLDLPRLFEKSMAKMMESLENLQDLDVWNDLSPELRNRIADMENVFRCSVVATGTNKLYFGSLDEYLAIFAENVQYYRERLAEAKERQAEEEPGGHCWQDAQAKIAKQEERFKTLEVVFKQQKELFAGSNKHARPTHPNRKPKRKLSSPDGAHSSPPSATSS